MALQLFFHPNDPKKLPGLCMKGVFPKKKTADCKQPWTNGAPGIIVFFDIEKTITQEDNVKKFLPLADRDRKKFLRNQLKKSMPVISIFIGDKTMRALKTVFRKEPEELFAVFKKNFFGNIKNDPDLEKIL